jgi:hypothetical protein
VNTASLNPLKFVRLVLCTDAIEADEIDTAHLAEGVQKSLADAKYSKLLVAVDLRLHGLTYREVARAMDLTPERIRQMEAKAARILRHPFYWRQLRGFIPGWHNCYRHPATFPFLRRQP